MNNIEVKANDFVAMQQSPETRRAYGRDMRVYFDFIEERGLSPEYIRDSDAIEFRDYLVDEYAPNGAARVWATVRTFYRNVMAPSPFDAVKAPKRTANVVPKVPDDEDVAAIVAAASDDPQRALVVALLLNGLRASEVGSLTKANIEQHDLIDESPSKVRVMRVVGKGQKERMVPATVETEMAMVRFWQTGNERQKASPFVVCDGSGGPLSYRSIEHIVYRTAARVGVQGMHPHALRHHYATRLIRAGASVLHVQKLLGHAKVSTTEVYVGLDLKDLVEASRKDPRNKTGQEAVRAVA